MKKIVLSWIICVFGLIGLFAWVGSDIFPPSGRSGGESPASVKGSFTLKDSEGKTVTEQQFRGQYTLIFFGFTHCPDICPTTLMLVQNAVSNLGGEVGKKIQPIFITVDPERDTPKVAGEYASHFGNTVGLSGTAAQIKQAADNFKVYYSKVPMSDPAMGYMMNHSGFLYLMGPDGEYVTHFAPNVAQPELEAGLRKYVR